MNWFFGKPGVIQWWGHKLRHPVPIMVEEEVNQWLEKNTGVKKLV
jgi:hypothetical protein